MRAFLPHFSLPLSSAASACRVGGVMLGLAQHPHTCPASQPPWLRPPLNVLPPPPPALRQAGTLGGWSVARPPAACCCEWSGTTPTAATASTTSTLLHQASPSISTRMLVFTGCANQHVLWHACSHPVVTTRPTLVVLPYRRAARRHDAGDGRARRALPPGVPPQAVMPGKLDVLHQAGPSPA